MTDRLLLPEGLEVNRVGIEEALGLPIPGVWPEEAPMLEAEQAAALAAAIIPLLHRHLVEAKIAYLFVEEKRERDAVKLGHAAKASSKIRFLAQVDYVVEFNWTAWKDLTAAQRVALVDHELCHCGGKDEKGKWVERGHDIEEFTAIVGRWGPWTGNLQQFGRVLSKQLSLLD